MTSFNQSTIAAVLLSTAALSTHAASTFNPWTDMISNGVQINATHKAAKAQKNALASQERMVTVTFSEVDDYLTHDSVDVPVMLPLPNGDMATYAFTYDPIMAPKLAAKYPQIRTYKAVDVRNPLNTGRFSITPRGFHGLFTHDGERVLIDPKLRHNTEKHTVYYKKHALPLSQRPADVVHHPFAEETATQRFAKAELLPARRTLVAGTQLITYRLAVSASGEYTGFHGGTKAQALAAITTTINRVNDIYERDLSVNFQLVDNNDKVIYTDASSDPFANDDANIDIKANTDVINSQIGLNNVDIAHVFTTNGGGLASLGVVCSSFKAQGVTGTDNPTGDNFDYSYVAHELGHQMGANHTFNGTFGSCGGENRNKTSAWEPGSGSTIMSYAGICGSDNLQADGNVLFHTGSIQEIRNVVNVTSCGTKTSIVNTTPTASAGLDFTIPAYTPFRLTGSGSDADTNDTLSYIWEQYDSGAASNLNYDGSSKDVGSGALFRSYTPVSTPVRYFPELIDVLNGTLSRGEGYPITDRILTMTFTVRDGKGGVATDSTRITVKNTGRAFSVIQPSAGTRWPENGQGRIVWDRAGTTEADINCQKVDILYKNGSGTFSQLLVTGTANDGEEIVNVPTGKTTNARIMVACTNNAFYAINPSNFSVVLAADATPLDTTPVPDGASTSPSTTPTQPTQPTTPSTGGSGGGGGSMPPIMVLLLLGAALISTACKHTGSSTQPERSHIPPGMADPNNQAVIIDLSITPEQAAKRAIAYDDYRLYVTGGRLPVPPGIPGAEQAQAKRLCGTRVIANTGDVLRKESDLSVRQKLTDYAASYNRAMYSYCKSSRE